jgi:hypothetical protein
MYFMVVNVRQTERYEGGAGSCSGTALGDEKELKSGFSSRGNFGLKAVF